MKLENIYAMMTASHSVAVRRFTIALSILLILIVIALGGNIWLLWRTTSTVAGGADRPFYKATSTALPSFGCTGEATVNYRAPERLHQMFRDGNKLMKEAYKILPWRLK